ncbi:MAG: TonB family protein [Acidobacteriota bacterium]
MPLTGHSDDVSLADLLQANALGRNTCRVMVTTPQGRGVFYLEEGAVVDAAFGELDGRDALFALLSARDSSFHVESGMTTHRRTIHDEWQHLLIEAMRREDGGALPAIATRPPLTVVKLGEPAPSAPLKAPAAAQPDVAGRTRPTATEAVSSPAPARSTSRRSGAAGGRIAALAVGAAALAALGYFAASLLGYGGATTAPASVAPTSTEPTAPPPAVEASTLVGPGDAAPRLLSGEAPRSPQPDLALSPTVTLRVLVGPDGNVSEARVFRSRLDLAPFEEAALEAVRTFRFQPAARGGSPVAAWVNLPVTFR